MNADSQDFRLPGYSLLPLFIPHRGFAFYIRSCTAFQNQPQLDILTIEFTAKWVKLKLNKATLHFCFLYRSSNLDCHQTLNRLDCLSDSITDILKKCADSEVAVAGDFSVHNVKWLTHSSHMTSEGENAEIFAISNQLTQLVNIPTHIPCVDGQTHNLLDLFLTSHPNKYEIEVLAPLGNSDHKVISANFPT